MIIFNENKTICWNVMYAECLACGISKSGFVFIAMRLQDINLPVCSTFSIHTFFMCSIRIKYFVKVNAKINLKLKVNCTINWICQFWKEFIYRSTEGTKFNTIMLNWMWKTQLKIDEQGKERDSPERLLLNRIWTIWFVHFLKTLSVRSPFVVHASPPMRMQTARKKQKEKC